MNHVYELGAPRIHTSHPSLDHDVEMNVVEQWFILPDRSVVLVLRNIILLPITTTNLSTTSNLYKK